MSQDGGLSYLLDLDGQILGQDGDYWIKIEARQLAAPTKACPHGIKYCLTLHDRTGERVLGFDNAHAVKVKKPGRYTGRTILYDHVHKNAKDKGQPYTFESAEQLISDFFNEVDEYLKKIK